MEKDKTYMRPAKAAKYFDVSENTLWRWIKEQPGFPEPIKMGERVTLFDITAIEQWMREKQ